MVARLFFILASGLSAVLFLAGNVPARGESPSEGDEVQTHGPVHEAYAEPGNPRPAPLPLVPREPPPAVEESPPEERPAGDNVLWVPGYWGWEEGAKDFLWVSGCWRARPPGRRWFPGAWQKAAGGWRRVAGYWSAPGPGGGPEAEYVPEPPASLDSGPSTPAPSPQSAYVPGCWVWRGPRFQWRPGFWMSFHPGWVWAPARYVWTPSGCIFVEGHWDYPLHCRGLLFAPVRFRHPAGPWRRIAYRPRYAVRADFLMGSLFVHQPTRKFYFGDYFGKRHVRAGYVSWVDYRVTGFSHEANLNYYRRAFAGHKDWERGLRELYTRRYNGTIPRPPRTLAEQTRLIHGLTAKKMHNAVVSKGVHLTTLQTVSAVSSLREVHDTEVTALAGLARVKPAEVKGLAAGLTPAARVTVAKVSKARLLEERRAGERYRALARERRDAESKAIPRPGGKPLTGPRKVTLTLPKGTPPARSLGDKVKTPPRPSLPKSVERPVPKPTPGPKPPGKPGPGGAG
jgi:hypothetical protein